MLNLIFCLLLTSQCLNKWQATLFPETMVVHNGYLLAKGAVCCFHWLQLLGISQLMLPWCQHGYNATLCFHHAQSNFLLLHALLYVVGANGGCRKRESLHWQFIGWLMVLLKGNKLALFLGFLSGTWEIKWCLGITYMYMQWMRAVTEGNKSTKTMFFQKWFWFWHVTQQMMQMKQWNM